MRLDFLAPSTNSVLYEARIFGQGFVVPAAALCLSQFLSMAEAHRP